MKILLEPQWTGTRRKKLSKKPGKKNTVGIGELLTRPIIATRPLGSWDQRGPQSTGRADAVTEPCGRHHVRDHRCIIATGLTRAPFLLLVVSAV
jgi:hypothetical protein